MRLNISAILSASILLLLSPAFAATPLPRDSVYIRVDNPKDAGAYYNRGIAKSDKGDLDGAIADYDRAIELNPKYARAYNSRGNAKDDKGDSDGAIADYTQAIKFDPKYAIAYYNRGIAKAKRGDLDGAVADYTRAIELGSTNPAAYNNRGAEKLKKGDFDGAITDCNRAIELDPEYANAYAIRAYAKDKTGDSDGAMADLGRAIKLNPKDASAYDFRGEIEARKKQYAAAIKDEQKAIGLDPKNGRYYSNLGWCELFNRKPRESITASLKALKLSPDDPVMIKANLAHAYLFNNQFEKAKALYLENKGAKFHDGQAFSQAVLDDFKEFKDAGITHPDMEKIKALLTTKTEASPAFATTPLPPDPIYISVDNGWKGFFAKNDQFVQYLLSGSDVKLQDPYHILLAPRVGLLVDYVSKNEFAGGDSNLLESHIKWVVDYWRKKADSVERKSRDDLSEKRKDLKVTELTIKGKDNPPIKMHVIGLASADGVFVFSISSPETNIDSMVREFVATLKLVHEKLDVKKETLRIKQGGDER